MTRVGRAALVGMWVLALAPGQVRAIGEELAVGPEAGAPRVGVVAVGDSGTAVLSHLQDILGYPLRRLDSGPTPDRAALVAAARATGEQLLLIVDGSEGRAEVIRLADGAELSRALPEGSDRSPYAVAFVAAELLKLSLQAGEAAPPEDPDPGEIAPSGGTAASVYLGLGAELRGNRAQLLLRPALLAGARVALPEPGLFVLASLRLAPGGTDSHQGEGTPDDAAGTEPATLSLTQHDLGLDLGLGLRRGPYGLLGLLRGGVSAVRWQLQGAPETADRQLRAWLGAALRGELKLLGGFGFFLEGGGVVSPLRTRYVTDAGVLLSPSRLDLVVLSGLSWNSSD